MDVPPSSGNNLLARSGREAAREYNRWLGRMESRAVLPMKWALLFITMTYWLWAREWELPSTEAFAVFFLFAAFTATQHYFFWRDRITMSQIRPLVYVSYVIDLLFITAVIYLDIRDPVGPVSSAAPSAGSEFYILYLLLVLRGFALFRTPLENAIVATLISILFLVSLTWTAPDISGIAGRAVVLRLALIWGTMLLATFIVNIVSRQQEEVLRVRERLIRSEGLASLGELAAGVAHEINNPIGIIKTYAEYLKKTVEAEDPRHEDFETIQAEAERCEMIVRRMLDFANPNVREMEDLDIAALVRDAVQFVFNEKTAGAVRGTAQIEERLPVVHGDPAQLRQALLNILINARQILSRLEGREGLVEVRVRQLPGPRAPIEIAIHDNGPGISPEDAEKAFEPFFSRRDGGTGLGLAITRRIIESHDGSIEIWPAANGGTTVQITLPIALED